MKIGDTTLLKDTDYTLSYTNNEVAGIETVTITGIGNYAGTLNKTFNVLAWTYTDNADNTSVTLTECTGFDADADITIPSSVGGKTVTSINSKFQSLFGIAQKSTQIKSVVIPNSVTSIGNNAFFYCQSLVSVTIPESVKSIGDNAFFTCKELISVTILGDITSIGNFAFSSIKSGSFIYVKNSTVADLLTSNNYTSTKTTIAYELDLELNGGELTDSTAMKYANAKTTSGGNIVNYAKPTKDGLVFDGWYDNAEFTGDKIDGDTNITAAKTLYPRYCTSISGATVTLHKDTYEYTGSEIKPEPTVVVGEKTLVKDDDYTLSYSNNTNLSTDTVKGTVTITGKGNYTGTITKTFEITDIPAISITDVNVSVSVSSVTYTGSAIEPSITVTQMAVKLLPLVQIILLHTQIIQTLVLQ